MGPENYRRRQRFPKGIFVCAAMAAVSACLPVASIEIEIALNPNEAQDQMGRAVGILEARDFKKEGSLSGPEGEKYSGQTFVHARVANLRAAIVILPSERRMRVDVFEEYASRFSPEGRAVADVIVSDVSAAFGTGSIHKIRKKGY